MAAHLYEEAARKAFEADDPLQAVWDRVGSVVAHVYAGRSPGSLPDEALDVARECGSPSALAIAHFARGEATENAEDLRLAVELAASVGSRLVGGIAEVSLATLHARRRDTATALRHYQSVIGAWHDAGAWAPQWVTLRTLTDLLAELGVTDEAAILYGAIAFSRGGAPPYGADAALLTASRSGSVTTSATKPSRHGPGRGRPCPTTRSSSQPFGRSHERRRRPNQRQPLGGSVRPR